MLPGDRLVCAFLEPRVVGTQFKTWFLHVTIVPWFRLDDVSETVARGLEKALKTVVPFELVGDGSAKFGPHKNRPVRLLGQSTPLMLIERQVRNYLHKKRAWIVDETTKVRRQFRPHVTNQGENGMAEGDTFRCDRLYIVEQKGDCKEIVSEVRFG